jgi:glyoxylase-like metal-dependent hydrolase (beta-lactamase superfamily II)
MTSDALRGSFFGGVLIAAGASSLLWCTGRLAGFNSIIDTVVFEREDFQFRWKSTWLLAFFCFGAGCVRVTADIAACIPDARLMCGAFLVGVGVRTARGCTSGHGIMGIARLSLRSLVATALFLTSGIAVATALPPIATAIEFPCRFDVAASILILGSTCYLWLAINRPTRKDTDGRVNWANVGATGASAILFASGLYVSGMHDPVEVNRFLNLLHPAWSPGLLITFLTGVAGTTLAMQARPARPPQALCERAYVDEAHQPCEYTMPAPRAIEPSLAMGAVLFGAGWGLSGLCPSTIPLRLGMGDTGILAASLPLLMGLLVGRELSRVVRLRNHTPRGSDVLHQFFEETSSTFTYVVGDGAARRVVIIDPVSHSSNVDVPTLHIAGPFWYCERVSREEALLRFVRAMRYDVVYILNTHMHVDHICGNSHLKRRLLGTATALPAYNGARSDVTIGEGDSLPITEQLHLFALRTPGHTANCMSFALRSGGCASSTVVFTGDALLFTSVGRTDLDDGESAAQKAHNRAQLFASLQVILHNANDDTLIAPCHEYGRWRGLCTLRRVRKLNPFLQHRTAQDFSQYLLERETTLAQFDSEDLQFCIEHNQVCGCIDATCVERLERLYSKANGACG